MVQDKRSTRLSSKSLNESDVERKSSLKKKGTPSWKSKNQSVKWRVENDKKDDSSAARYRSSGLSSDCESSDNGRKFRQKRFTKIRRSASETSSCTSVVSEETTSVCSSSDGYNSSITGKKRKVVRRYQARSPAKFDAGKRKDAWSSGQSCTSAETSTCESYSDGKGTVTVRKTRSQNTRRKGRWDSGVSCTSDTSGGESLYAKSRKLYRQRPSSKNRKNRELWRHVKKQRRVKCGDEEYIVTSESSCSIASSRGSYRKTSKKVSKTSNQCAYFPMPIFDEKGCPIGVQPVPMKQMQAMFCATQNVVERREREEEDDDDDECGTIRKPKEIECTKVKTCIKEKYSTCSSSVASQTEKKSTVVRGDSKKMKTFGNPPERILQNFEDKNPENCSMSDEDNKVVKTKEKIVYDPETKEKKLVTITKTCQTKRVRSNCGNKSDAESAEGVSKGGCGEIEIKSSKMSHITNSDKSSSCHSSRRITVVKKSGNCSDRSSISKGDKRGSSYIGAVNDVLRKKQAYERALQKLEDGEDVEKQLRCLERKQRPQSGKRIKNKRKRRKKQMESSCDEVESTASCRSEIVFMQPCDGSNECSASLTTVDCEREVTETCQQVEETCQDISDICDDDDCDDEKPLKDLMCRQLAYFKSVKQAKKFKQDYVDCLEENKDNAHRSVCVEMELADLRCLYKKALRKVRKKKRAYQRCLAELGITMQEDEELKRAEDIENKYKRKEFKSYFGQFTVSKRPDKVGASKSLLLVNNRMKEMRDKTQFLKEAFNAKLQKREENKLSEATEVLEKLHNVVESMKSGIPLLEVQNLRKFLERGVGDGGKKRRKMCPPPDPCSPCLPDPCSPCLPDPCAPPMTDCERTISVFSDKLLRDATNMRSVTVKGCSSRSSAGGRQFSQTSISIVEKKRCPPSKKKKKKKGKSGRKNGNCGGGCGCCTTATGNWKTASCAPFCEINCREPIKPKRPASSAKEMVKMLADTIKQKDCNNYVDLFKYKVNEKKCTPKKRKPELKTHYQMNEKELKFEDEKRAISKKFEDPFDTRKLKEMFPMFARFEQGCNGAMTPKELYDCVHDCGLGTVNFTIETAVKILENWVTDEREVSIKECLFAVHKPETYLKVVKDEMLLCNAVEEWIEKFRSRLSRNLKKEKKQVAAAGILKSRCGKLQENTAEDEFLRLKRRHWMESEKDEESSIGINSS